MEVLDDIQRRELMTALGRVPDVLEDLDVTISRTSQTGSVKVGGPVEPAARERLIPFHEGASRARRNLVDLLRAHALRVGVYVGINPPHEPHRRAAWLVKFLPGVPSDERCLEGITMITAAVVDAVVVIDRTEQRLCLGSCSNCDAYMYASLEQTHVECGHCGHCWPVDEMRQRLLERAECMVGTASQLSRLLPWVGGKDVKAGTIRQWAFRGKLRGNETIDGGTVYWLGDVLKLANGETLDYPVL